jgi:cobalamin biosynthesis Mg chelatase CobN
VVGRRRAAWTTPVTRVIRRGQQRPRAFRDWGLSRVPKTAILPALLTVCSTLGLLSIADGANAEKAATSPATTSTPRSTATATPRPMIRPHSTTTTTRSDATTRHASATTPHHTATAPHSTATAPQPKNGLIQSKTKAIGRPSASVAGSNGWPTSAIVAVAALAAVLFAAVTALLLSRRQHNHSAPESYRSSG